MAESTCGEIQTSIEYDTFSRREVTLYRARCVEHGFKSLPYAERVYAATSLEAHRGDEWRPDFSKLPPEDSNLDY